LLVDRVIVALQTKLGEEANRGVVELGREGRVEELVGGGDVVGESEVEVVDQLQRVGSGEVSQQVVLQVGVVLVQTLGGQGSHSQQLLGPSSLSPHCKFSGHVVQVLEQHSCLSYTLAPESTLQVLQALQIITFSIFSSFLENPLQIANMQQHIPVLYPIGNVRVMFQQLGTPLKWKCYIFIELIILRFLCFYLGQEFIVEVIMQFRVASG